MNNEITEKFYISKGNVMPASEFSDEDGKGSEAVYEVIRVISGVPLFLEKHMNRLKASARLIGRSVEPIADKLSADIKKLIEINNKPEKNIKIVVTQLDNPSPNYAAYFIKSSYPGPEDYTNGVPTILLEAERENPNAKIVNRSFKELAAAALKKTGAYEALLVNEKGEITEGSRSNIFFVKSNKVYTSPKGSVLMGITRESMFELCSKLGIEMVEKPIDTGFLKEIDGLFMTGTSPKVLPIKSVDSMYYTSASNPIITKLMNAYNDMIEEYVLANKQVEH